MVFWGRRVKNTFLSFVSGLSAQVWVEVGKGKHPRDEILGAEIKGRDIFWSINSGNTKPRRREENLSGSMGQ